MLVESGNAQPRTLANAFLEPVGMRGNVIENAYVAMSNLLEGFDAMYGRAETEQRVHAGIDTKGYFGEKARPLTDVGRWVRERVVK